MYFYKNQFFYILIASGFFLYSAFHFSRYRVVEQDGIGEQVLIVDKSCYFAPWLQFWSLLCPKHFQNTFFQIGFYRMYPTASLTSLDVYYLRFEKAIQFFLEF